VLEAARVLVQAGGGPGAVLGRVEQPHAALHGAGDELGLAVALYACNADDLAGTHLERDLIDHLLRAIVVHAQSAQLEHQRAGMRRAFVDFKQHTAPHHHLGQAALSRAMRRCLAHHLAAPQQQLPRWAPDINRQGFADGKHVHRNRNVIHLHHLHCNAPRQCTHQFISYGTGTVRDFTHTAEKLLRFEPVATRVPHD